MLPILQEDSCRHRKQSHRIAASLRWRPSTLVWFLCTALVAVADPTGPLLTEMDASAAGGVHRVYVVMLNPDSEAYAYQFPETISVHRLMSGHVDTVTLHRDGTEPGRVVIAPGGFSRWIYKLPESEMSVTPMEISLTGNPNQHLVLTPGRSTPPEPTSEPPTATVRSNNAEGTTSALRYFDQHIFPHEPMYLLMGWEDPNVKFQISFKYRPLNADSEDPGWLVRNAPRLTNLYLAYTQTSLWDTGAPSSPFYDTTYKPELFYQWNGVDRDRWAPWLGLDLQGGLQHASNGQAGSESRSFNVAYVMPTLRLGDPAGFFARISPRIYGYLGSLEDNPDIADYYGHVQLRGIIGWAERVQLSVIGTIGDGFHHGNAQIDLTYPLYRLGGRNLSVYLDLQYFNGYGESLLDYNQRSSAFRAGISLWR